MRFEWDETKNDANLRKHGVTFEEAIAIFSDPRLDEVDVTEDDYGEERWAASGRVNLAGLDVLVVIYTDRVPETRRIISARRADRRETNAYYSRLAPIR